MSAAPHTPFGRGSVAFGPYAQNLPVSQRVDDLITQARVAADAGFDGLTVSEHHAGFPSYLPNPLEVVTWFLEQTDIPWAAPCPILLPLRQPPLVVEDVAWLAARNPGRVGVGFAPGYVADDFRIVRRSLSKRFVAFERGLSFVTQALRGEATGALAKDDAVAACAEQPITVISAAASKPAVRRAARAGAGIIFGSFASAERCRELVDTYREAGGTGPTVLIRRGWCGELPRPVMDSVLGSYQHAKGAPSFLADASADELVVGGQGEVLERLNTAWAGSGCDALNLRVHFPGISPSAIHEQIEQFGRVANDLTATARR